MMHCSLEPIPERKRGAPVTMTLHFIDAQVAEKFIALCRSKGIRGVQTRCAGGKIKVTAHLKNKTARTSLTSLWGELSLTR